jgi:hypothetical protein
MPFDDPITQIRAALRGGLARVLGTATVDGRAVYKIQFTGKDGADDSQKQIAYVDQQTYRPLALDAPQQNGHVIRLRVTAFQYLPATTANMRLLSLAARHPTASLVHDRSSSTSTSTNEKG